MSVRLRLVGVALALILPGLLLAGWSLTDGPSLQVPPTALPSQVGPWSGTADERLEDRILEVLGVSSYVARTYEAGGSPPIGLYVGFYNGRVGQSKMPHDPEVCFPSAGWETLATQRVEVPVPGGDTLLAHLLDTHKGTARQLVLYWFQPAGRWPRGMIAEELLFLVDALAGRPQFAFIRLVAAVPDDASRPAVLGELLAFAGEFAWPLRAVVSGDAPPTALAEATAPSADRDPTYGREN